jgi:hypothetical protein
MKKSFTLLFCLFLFASCSTRLVTKGLQNKTSNYVVTTSGKHIDAASVSINDNKVTADTATYQLTNVSAIKIGESYYSLKNGELYEGVYYGKLILLKRFGGMVYTYSTTRTTAHAFYNFYLQKEGQSEIVDFDNKSLIENVRDNPLALRKARAAQIYGTVNTVSIFTAIAGLACVFLPYNSPVRKPGVTVGLFSMPAFLITLPIAPHKKYKAVVVYNR